MLRTRQVRMQHQLLQEKIGQISITFSEPHSQLNQTIKMVPFTKIVNGYNNPLTIFAEKLQLRR